MGEDEVKHVPLISTGEGLDPWYLQVNEISARTRGIWTSARYLQNSFVPVNRLPPEILGLIPSSLPSKRDLINATAVCRHWRDTLLSSPDLWCDIDCSGSRGPLRDHMFRECLGRSGTVPLNIRLTSVRYLPDITPHLARFSALEIMVVAPEQLQKIASRFSQPAPILQKLNISGVAPWTQIGLSIPPGLFGGDFASLRTLRLVGFSFLKLPPHFPQLTRFDLKTHAHSALRTDAMLEALERMPLLQVLHVKFCPDHPPSSSTSAPRLPTPPKLKEVELSSFNDHAGPPPFIPPLLSALVLPIVEQVMIGVLPPTGSATLPSSFEEQLPNLAETATVDLFVDPEVFTLLFHGLRGSRLLFTSHYSDRRQFRREGFCGTPFLSVKKMAVTFNMVYDVELEVFFFELLRAMERLESLEIRGWCTRLLGLWSEKSPLDQRSICPSLRSLVVTRKSNDSISGLLKKLAMARKRHGVPFAEAIEVLL